MAVPSTDAPVSADPGNAPLLEEEGSVRSLTACAGNRDQWQKSVGLFAGVPAAVLGLLALTAVCMQASWGGAPADTPQKAASLMLRAPSPGVVRGGASQQATPEWQCHQWSAIDKMFLRPYASGVVPISVQRSVCLRRRTDGAHYRWNDHSMPGCTACVCCVSGAPAPAPMAVPMPAPTAVPTPAPTPKRILPHPTPPPTLAPTPKRIPTPPPPALRRWSQSITTTPKLATTQSETSATVPPLLGSTISPGDLAKTAPQETPHGVLQIKEKQGSCIDGGGQLVHVWKCDPANRNQQWVYDKATMQIRSWEGFCLTATPHVRGAIVKMACSAGAEEQQWVYESRFGRLHSRSGDLCMNAPEGSHGGGVVEMDICMLSFMRHNMWDLLTVPANKVVKFTQPATERTPRSSTLRTFYIYRAQNDYNYRDENLNVADLGGVLWYLHNEVVTMCPRKWNITRIRRIKLTMRVDEVAPYIAFDKGKCTVAGCNDKLKREGYRVGCQYIDYGGIKSRWYSLPGACPGQEVLHKTERCMKDEPGGWCAAVTGQRSCTYHTEDAGEVRLNELTDISDYSRFCEEGKLEYSKQLDQGKGFHFWDGFKDREHCARRVQLLMDAFAMKYPHTPVELDPPLCI